MFRKETSFSLTVSTDFEAREYDTRFFLPPCEQHSHSMDISEWAQVFEKRATPNLPSSRIFGSGVEWSGGEARKLAQTFESGDRPKLHRSTVEFDLITEGS